MILCLLLIALGILRRLYDFHFTDVETERCKWLAWEINERNLIICCESKPTSQLQAQSNPSAPQENNRLFKSNAFLPVERRVWVCRWSIDTVNIISSQIYESLSLKKQNNRIDNICRIKEWNLVFCVCYDFTRLNRLIQWIR